MRRLQIILFAIISVILIGCQEEQLSSDPTLRLSFSADTLRFDTVFTTMGSSTYTIMVYNRNKNAVKITDVSTSTDYFRVNLDGENDPERMKDLTINGGDSLFMFVRSYIDTQAPNTPVFISDSIRFSVNGNQQHVQLEAYGQNVELIRTSQRHSQFTEYHFTADKPYLIFDTISVAGTTIIDAGATLYMHYGSSLRLSGDVRAIGTLESPIRITGDRLDRLFPKVSYQKASGQWDGIYLIHHKDSPKPYDTLQYVDILSGNTGLYCYSEDKDNRRQLCLSNSRIHNHAHNGVVLHNVDADIHNCEISNCASYCLLLAGGTQTLTHNTIASFYGYPYTNINIHSTGREDVAAVYISLLNKDDAPTTANIYNSIIAGARQNNLVVATPLQEYYNGEIAGNYLACDTINFPWCHDNVYSSEQDTVFVNTYYLYKEYTYYNFQLDSVSPARGIALPAHSLPYPYDRLGTKRQEPIDAGCYQRKD